MTADEIEKLIAEAEAALQGVTDQLSAAIGEVGLEMVQAAADAEFSGERPDLYDYQVSIPYDAATAILAALTALKAKVAELTRERNDLAERNKENSRLAEDNAQGLKAAEAKLARLEGARGEPLREVFDRWRDGYGFNEDSDEDVELMRRAALTEGDTNG